MKKLSYILLATLCLVSVGILSCGSYLDRVTPSNLPKQSTGYVGKDPCDFGRFHSLYEAEQLMREVLTVRRDRLLDWDYWLKKDKAAYQDAKGYLEPAIAESRATQALFIGDETQPISLIGLMGYLGFGGIGTLLGKNLLKRNKDYTPEQHDLDVVNAREEGKLEATA